MEGMMLIDARQAASVGNVSRSFLQLECFVVGFEATVPHPRKYLYQGCSVIVSNGRYCSKSVLSPDGKCPDHDCLPDQISKAMFRFDIFLADGSLGKRCRPLRAVIFSAAQDLLGITPDEFQGKGGVWQDRLVSRVMMAFPYVTVSIQVKNGSIVVTDLTVDTDIVETLPAFSKRAVSQSRPRDAVETVNARSNVNIGFRTPPRRKSTTVSPSVYKTPRAEFSQRSATSRGESSASSSRSNVSVQDLLSLRKQFDELLSRTSAEQAQVDEGVEVIIVSDDE